MPVSGPALRTGRYFTTLFMPAAVSVVYLGPWLAQSGLDTGQIGLINAAPVLAMLLISLLAGRLADRAPDWRQVIVLGTGRRRCRHSACFGPKVSGRF